MTANLVTGLSPMQELKTGTAANVNPASSTDFSDVLKNSTDKGNEALSQKEPVKKAADDKELKPKTEEPKAADADKPVKGEKADDKEPVKTKTDKAEEVKEPLSEEAKDEITEAVATMVQTIAEVLEIPAAQVEEAIEDLNMVDMEVLNPNTIPNLVVELTDAADVTEIMTDETLFADVKQLMTKAEELVNEAADTLQIPVEDLKSQIGEEAEIVRTAKEPVVETVVTMEEQPVEHIDSIDRMDRTDRLDRRPEERPVVTEETAPQIKADDTEEIAPVSARHEENKGQDERNDRSDNKGTEHFNFTQTVTDTIKGMVAERTEEALPTYTTTMEQIMDQVSESMRVTMTEDITEMEMQLHPASLGNVRVQVAAKDGVITASFTTENQQVKEVLEAQIIQLKDQMNEQGIKVEAVEVTVSSHAFEHNLNDNGENRGGQPEAEAKRKRVRGINLSGGDLNDIDLEELDEEDKVTADMMARQGNTVDYMA